NTFTRGAERAFNKLARTFAAQVEALKRSTSKRTRERAVLLRNRLHMRETAREGHHGVVDGGHLRPEHGLDLILRFYPLDHRKHEIERPLVHRLPSKRTRERCKAPAVRGWTVCRFHGAHGGAPKGKANGAYKHGLYTAEARVERRLLADLLRQSRKVIAGPPSEESNDFGPGFWPAP